MITKKRVIGCPYIKLNPDVERFVSKFSSAEDLLRYGGIEIEMLDRLAFGFSDSDIKQLLPEQLKIKWKTDLENVKFEIQKSGKSPRVWAEEINLENPIDVSFEKGGFYIEDGHHRYMAAKILKKPLMVNLEIKSNPIKALAPEIGYDDFHRCVFKQVKDKMNLTETVRKTLNEYLTNDEVALMKYFSRGEEEIKKHLPHEYPWFFDDFLVEDDIEFEKPTHTFIDADGEQQGDEMQSYELIDYLERKNPDIYKKFGEYLYRKINNHELPISDAEYPAWTYFSDSPEIVKNQWLIHFTNDAQSIAEKGFKYGVIEIERLGLTTHLSNIEKAGGGYNFAYLLKDFQKYGYSGWSKYKYGKEAVIFRASGVKLWHHGDQEPQVIFYGETANNIIPLLSGDNANWAIYNKKGNLLYENDKLELVVNWLVKNWDQYRKNIYN